MFSSQPGPRLTGGVCTTLHQPVAESPLHGWSEAEKGTHLLETPGTAGVNGQTLLTCAGSSGGAHVWTWNQKQTYNQHSEQSFWFQAYIEILIKLEINI